MEHFGAAKNEQFDSKARMLIRCSRPKVNHSTGHWEFLCYIRHSNTCPCLLLSYYWIDYFALHLSLYKAAHSQLNQSVFTVS